MKVVPSNTSTSLRPVCRFCLDSDESCSPLIRPCDCRGTVALVHSYCLERWVDTQKNTVCQLCRVGYEQESAGWRPFSDWRLPRALSEEWDDRLDFACALLWAVYISRFLAMWISLGSIATRQRIAEVVGEGAFAWLWWTGFWLNTIYYGAVAILVTDQWMADHRVYKFKDRSTREERKERELEMNTMTTRSPKSKASMVETNKHRKAPK